MYQYYQLGANRYRFCWRTIYLINTCTLYLLKENIRIPWFTRFIDLFFWERTKQSIFFESETFYVGDNHYRSDKKGQLPSVHSVFKLITRTCIVNFVSYEYFWSRSIRWNPMRTSSRGHIINVRTTFSILFCPPK